MLGKLDSIPSLSVTRALCETYDTVEWMTHNVFWTPTLLYNGLFQKRYLNSFKLHFYVNRNPWLLCYGKDIPRLDLN